MSTGAGDRVADPGQAMVWGLGRVAALEHPDRWGGLVDLPAGPDTVDTRAAARLAGVLSGAEDQVAVRASGVFARRLLRAPAPVGEREAWPVRGTTLITGAFGALGRRLARWLAGRGAERLVLIGRNPDAGLAGELAGLGAEVEVAACDVGDREALAAVLEGRSVRVVVHAAGVLDDGVIDALDPERLARVLRAKADGARHLHELTTGLDAFVLFSSATGGVGNAGQGNYAAANAYLDALAEQRRADGLPATSIGWGPWGDGGMADTEEVGARLRRGGMAPLDPDLALEVLDTACGLGESGLVVAEVDWARFATVFGTTRRSPLLAELAEARPAGPPAAPLARDLAGMTAGARARALRELVCEHAAQVLGHDSTALVQLGVPFHEQGFSSLGVVELRNQLSAATGLKIPASALFDHPTPSALAAHLDTEITPAAGPEPEPGPEVGDLEALLSLAERELAQE